LLRFDLETESFESWQLSSANVHSGIIRHMRAGDDAIWAHQTATGAILRIRLQGDNND